MFQDEDKIPKAWQTFAMPAGRVINRALHVQLMCGRAKIRHLQAAVFSALAGLVFSGSGAFVPGRLACFAVLAAIHAVLWGLNVFVSRSNQSILDTLGWDGWTLLRTRRIRALMLGSR